jgi:hypothetical protein
MVGCLVVFELMSLQNACYPEPVPELHDRPGLRALISSKTRCLAVPILLPGCPDSPEIPA